MSQKQYVLGSHFFLDFGLDGWLNIQPITTPKFQKSWISNPRSMSKSEKIGFLDFCLIFIGLN
jgi:hypothetical protein